MALDDERDDPAEGRVEEPVAEPEEGGAREQDPEGEVPARVDPREGRDHRATREIGDDHQRAPRVPVCKRAADQQRRQEGEAVHHQDDRERAALAGERGRPPAERDQEGAVADERDRLARPEEPEVAAAERGRRACEARGDRGGLHEATVTSGQ